MIIKHREKPLKLKKLEALARRLPLNYPNREAIKLELTRRTRGYRGEQALDYHLTFLPPKQHYILQSLRLPNDYNEYFQLDTLVLSKGLIINLEVKNLLGTLHFESKSQQLIRIFNDKEEGFANPLEQIRRQELQLKPWLKKHQLPTIPIISQVVISNPSTIVKTDRENADLYKKVIHALHVPSRIEQLTSQYNQHIFRTEDLQKSIHLLQKEHTPEKYDILKHFNIHSNEIQKGVHCPKCFHLPMTRTWGRWICPKCGNNSNDAHIHSLKDYSLLINDTISNKQLCDFLLLPSRSVATKLLTALNLPHSGKLKDRKYELGPHLDEMIVNSKDDLF